MADPTGPVPVESARVRGRFDEVVVPEIPVLWRAACAITGDPVEAEDLVQDTLLRAFRFLNGFDGRHPRAWLLTILRNTHRNRNRRRRPSLWPTGEIPDDATPSVPSAEDDAVHDLLDGRIAAALATLSPKLAQVVALIDIAGFSYDEAAATLGVPVGTVMSRLHRARRRIRRELGGQLELEGEGS